VAIKVPGKRYGKRLRKSKVFGEGGHGKKAIFADLLVTPLVDMFVIIVLFLIANFSATGEILMMTNDIQLPEAKNVKELDHVPVVQVSNDEVVVDGSVIGRVEDIVRDELLNIQALEEKLRDMRKQYEDLRSGSGEAFKGDVNIQGHKEVQFKIIKKVMFSCAIAGYNNINFAVLGAPPEEGAAPAAEGTGTAGSR
jgi:biopolymer transport protein ExbD